MLWFVIRLIFKTNSVTPGFFYVFNLILSFSTCSQSLSKICAWEVLGANVLKFRKIKGPKKDEYKRTKDPYILTFSTHRENKPFEVGAEPRRRRAKCKTSSGNKTSLPGAVADLKSLFAKGP